MRPWLVIMILSLVFMLTAFVGFALSKADAGRQNTSLPKGTEKNNQFLIDWTNVKSFVDKEHNVICYVADQGTTVAVAISCVPLSNVK